MSTKILLVGCSGAMGRTISDEALKDDTYIIAAGIDKTNNNYNYPVYNDFKDIKEEIDAIIDFSNRSVLYNILDYALEKKIPAVLSTTGYSENDIEAIQEASKRTPLFRSANMSYGVNVMIELLQKASKLLQNGYDIEIIEKHHNKKKDSPSGTAKMLADAINQSLVNRCEYTYGREGNETLRNEKEIGIHAVRGGTIPGEHTVIYAGNDEIIEIKHIAMSKKIFAIGSLKAAKFMAGKEPGLYDMNDMLCKE